MNINENKDRKIKIKGIEKKIPIRAILFHLAILGISIVVSIILFIKLEHCISWIEIPMVMLVPLSVMVGMLLFIWIICAYYNFQYSRWVKDLPLKERKREKENYKISEKITDYMCKKYGNNHSFEAVDVNDEKNKYSIIYKKQNNPQKIKVSFDKRSSEIKESYAN